MKILPNSFYFPFGLFHWIQFHSEIKVICRHEHPARPRSHHSDQILLAITISAIGVDGRIGSNNSGGGGKQIKTMNRGFAEIPTVT